MSLHTTSLLTALIALLLAQTAFAQVKGDLYVSPQGKDTWSGTLAEPKADASDGPLAGLDAARKAVAKIRKSEPKRATPVVVLIRGGTYQQTDTITFGPGDSGTEKHS